MTTEVQMLAASVVLTAIIPLLVLPANLATPGAAWWGLGNRDTDPPKRPEWVGRAKRAHANMLENLPLLIGMILAVHLAGRSGPSTALGAQVFFFARVGFVISYLLGIPVVRPLFHFAGMGGLLLIASALV
jgi:uncharacterized MAPEG superfamily protein